MEISVVVNSDGCTMDVFVMVGETKARRLSHFTKMCVISIVAWVFPACYECCSVDHPSQ